MSRRQLRALAVFFCLGSALVTTGARAEPALVEVGNLVLRADGGLRPQSLPRRHFAPVDFRGRVEIATKDGSRPSPLVSAVVDFDRDGRLAPAGLPACSPDSIAAATPAEARQLCPGALVGSGSVRVTVALPGGPAQIGSPLTIFNGPSQEGRATAVLHAQIAGPETETFAIVVPIERRRGRFRYRATLTLPPIADGLGSVTHLDVKLGRRFEVAGQTRSYLAARCPDGTVQTRGRFTFADGTVIDGSVEKYCGSYTSPPRAASSTG